MALLRRDAGAAWWLNLVPGGLIVTVFQDDEIANERLGYIVGAVGRRLYRERHSVIQAARNCEKV